MKAQDEFVGARRRDWEELDQLLRKHDALHKLDGPSISRVASLYRALCADVTRCRTARYTPDLIAYLDGLAARVHASLYSAKPFRMPSVWRLLAWEFPAALRKNRQFFALSTALFLAPWAIGLAGSMLTDSFARDVLPGGLLEQMREAYSTAPSGREAAINSAMAGFYVYNNVGIAFRCFATGIFFGLGSVFFLIYNGLVIGTVTGHVTSFGYGAHIWTFMCGHAPFEITAIWISGAAGLRMGASLLDTRGLTRVASVRRSAPEIGRMILGAAFLLVIAAFVEGFWSPSSAPAPVKWAASAVFALLVTAYLTLAGRRSRRHPLAPVSSVSTEGPVSRRGGFA